MSFHYSSDSLEDIHQCLVETLVHDPEHESSPRGKPVRELVAASFTLTDPRNRLIMSPSRSVNYGFAVGELCWYVRGDTDLATMLYYNKRMAQFSDDGHTINSAYGSRIFRSRWLNGRTVSGEGVSQLDNVIEELRRDPHSRRAVIHINEPGDLRHAAVHGSKDVPCTMSLQLFIRDRLLSMHVLMRSNDVIWGLPYDVFSFTCLQEAFAHRLREAGVQVDGLGAYHHTAGSLHIYDTHFEMGEGISREALLPTGPMAPLSLEQLELLAHSREPAIRRGEITGYDVPMRTGSEFETCEWMVTQLVRHHEKRDIESQAKKESP